MERIPSPRPRKTNCPTAACPPSIRDERMDCFSPRRSISTRPPPPTGDRNIPAVLSLTPPRRLPPALTTGNGDGRMLDGRFMGELLHLNRGLQTIRRTFLYSSVSSEPDLPQHRDEHRAGEDEREEEQAHGEDVPVESIHQRSLRSPAIDSGTWVASADGSCAKASGSSTRSSRTRYVGSTTGSDCEPRSVIDDLR